MLALLGLVLIITGWLIQLKYCWNGRREIRRLFIGTYGLGVVLLVMDEIAGRAFEEAILNTCCLVVAGLLLYRLSRR